MAGGSVFKQHGSSDDEKVERTGWELFNIVWTHNESKLTYIFTCIFCLGNGVLPMIMQMFMGNMINDYAKLGQDENVVEGLKPMILNILYTNIGQLLFMTLSGLVRSHAGTSLTTGLRKKVFASLMRQPIEYFDERSTGVLMSRLTEDIALVNEVYFGRVMTILLGLGQVLANLILVFTTSWMISLIVIVSLPLVVLTHYFGEKIIESYWEQHNNRSTSANSQAEQVITQFRTVKSFDGEMKESAAFSKKLDGLIEINKITSIASGVKNALIGLIGNAAISLSLYLVSYLILIKPEKSNGLEVGDSMKLMMGMMLAQTGIIQVFSSFEFFRSAHISAAKILKIITTKPAIDLNKGKELDEVKGKIEFKDVGFKYKSRDDWAVRHLTFTIEAGETVALVGESGCGKTTTLALLQRFYELDEGQILVDGHDIKELSSVFLRKQITPVPQTPVLFSMSVRDNIKFGKPDATNKEVDDAAIIGNAKEFIMSLKDNYSQEVNQTSLSGGQKQRICISRAILMNSPIMLLDEATAALDTESEQLVQKSIEQVRKNKTCIIVAHRLATVKNVDKIFVFKNGMIAEEGTHENLLAKKGIYAELIKYQLQ